MEIYNPCDDMIIVDSSGNGLLKLNIYTSYLNSDNKSIHNINEFEINSNNLFVDNKNIVICNNNYVLKSKKFLRIGWKFAVHNNINIHVVNPTDIKLLGDYITNKIECTTVFNLFKRASVSNSWVKKEVVGSNICVNTSNMQYKFSLVNQIIKCNSVSITRKISAKSKPSFSFNEKDWICY